MDVIERYEKAKLKAIEIQGRVRQSFNSAKDLKAQYEKKTRTWNCRRSHAEYSLFLLIF